MAKFCRHCGQPLEEGQVCTCEKAQAAAQAPVATAEAPAAAPAAGNALVNSLKAALLSYWKSPKAAAAAVAESKSGMTIAGIFAGVNFLAVFFFLWRIIGLLISLIADANDGKVSDFIEDNEVIYPILSMLVAGLAIAAIGIAVTALVIFIAAKINKQAVDLKKQIVIEAVHSIVPTVLLIVGILLGFLAAWLQFIMLALILVLWFVNVCNEVREVAGVQIMETGKTMTIYTLVIFVGLAIAIWLMTAIGGWGIGELSIEDTKLSEAFEDTASAIMFIARLFL